MSHDTSPAGQDPAESAAASHAFAAVAFQGAPFPIDTAKVDNCQDANRQELGDTCHPPTVDNEGMPKSRGQPESVDVEGISVELRRFQLLVRLMRQHAGINRAEISRRTGIDETHLSKLCNPERTGRTGLSADIVRQVRIGLNISPDFFFDPQLKNVADEADLLKVYSLDEQRQKKWQASVDEQLHELSQFRLEMQAMLAMKDHEINRLKHELAQAAQNGGPRKRPPR